MCFVEKLDFARVFCGAKVAFSTSEKEQRKKWIFWGFKIWKKHPCIFKMAEAIRARFSHRMPPCFHQNSPKIYQWLAIQF